MNKRVSQKQEELALENFTYNFVIYLKYNTLKNGGENYG